MNIIKVKMQRNLTFPKSDFYQNSMSIFDDFQPEYLFLLLKNFIIAIYRIGWISPLGKIKYLRIMSHGEVLRELYELASQNNGTTKQEFKQSTLMIIN